MRFMGLLSPVVFLIHGFDNTGNGLPKLLNHLLDFSRILFELFLECKLDSVDAALETGVDLVLDFLVGFVPR